MANHLAVPTVHLGGTSRLVLMDETTTALQAVQAAREALALAAPNQRDYIGRPEGWQAAVLQHGARMDRLRDVETELEQLAEAIHDGGHRA